jgi:hypothetical protein
VLLLVAVLVVVAVPVVVVVVAVAVVAVIVVGVVVAMLGGLVAVAKVIERWISCGGQGIADSA